MGYGQPISPWWRYIDQGEGYPVVQTQEVAPLTIYRGDSIILRGDMIGPLWTGDQQS